MRLRAAACPGPFERPAGACVIHLQVFRTAMNQPLLPITVISGFVGAGNSALVDQILSNRTGPRVAAIVTDLAAVRLDIDNAAPATSNAPRIELPNDSLCVQA